MTTIVNAHLALLIGGDIVGPDHMGVGFVDGQDLGPLLFALDDPEVKDFGGDQALVLIAQLFCKIVQLISSMQYALCGLPDSTDFVSLWLCWGNLTVEQQADLKDFQAKGSRAVLCWRAGDIGDNLTPGGNDDAVKEAFWGFDPKDEQSCIEAAKKYALAIVDTCNKYNIDGFDYDIEDWGTLMNSSMPSVPNAFMKTLREEFDKTGKMLVADIPGGAGWLSFYEVLSEETVLSLDYIAWQTYELGHSGLDSFFEAVRRSHPNVFKEAMGKSIVTATFERAVDKHYFTEQQSYHPACGIEHAGMGAYHIEYDYPGNPDYPTVRAAIAAQNPPINN